MLRFRVLILDFSNFKTLNLEPKTFTPYTSGFVNRNAPHGHNPKPQLGMQEILAAEALNS